MERAPIAMRTDTCIYRAEVTETLGLGPDELTDE